ncbi:molybdate ABC transporter substrate-binding protein [Clostridium cylindrosporum]|uniref:Putative ABC transporter substrate-binding lipoprotein YvgL n=1 Tax=Clostridium cylindrosporum DSM 605 TaxID=1121307 RepID=A0A0J8D9M7_CLOCY|nr:molybdate ABC transporter substrate-binding protein [Clostridium cylindrosporum]KMT22542.1 putative ABC transporter substrate-binding lipoprotein YvgL [Clostridium cylindrosporum DSM 605]
MKKKTLFTLFTFVILVCFSLVGCRANQENTSKSENTTTQKTELTVAAASSLKKAFTEIGSEFEKDNNSKVTFSFGATSTLAEQVINGAPFDLFVAANVKDVDKLIEKGALISDTKKLYALGLVGIATPKNSKVQVKTIEDLLNPEIKKIAIANPETAPYGLAAKNALETAGLWDKLKSKMVYGKSISETATLITTGNADAGFIALSLKDDKTLNFNLIDQKMHKPLNQAMAIVKASKNQELAKKFIEYVNSEKGKLIMNKYGFEAPKE